MKIAEIRARHEADEKRLGIYSGCAPTRFHLDRAALLDLVARMRPWLVAQRNALETFPNGTEHPEFAALDALVKASE